MDIAKLSKSVDAQNEGVPLNIVDPVEGNNIGLSIVIYGPDSDAQAEAKVEARDAISKLRQASIAGTIAEGESEDISLSMLAKCVKSWDAVEEGQSLNCTPENIKRVLKRFPWIRSQVDQFANSRAPYKQFYGGDDADT